MIESILKKNNLKNNYQTTTSYSVYSIKFLINNKTIFTNSNFRNLETQTIQELHDTRMYSRVPCGLITCRHPSVKMMLPR